MLTLFLQIIEEEGEQKKFLELYGKYKHRMFYIAREILRSNELAEDAVQDTFLYFALNINFIDEDVNSGRTRNFVYLVTKHKAIDILRKVQKECYLSEEVLERIGGGYEHVEQMVLQKQEYESVVKSILELPPNYRECLELNIVYDLPAKKVASLLNEKYETIKKRIQRGKVILRKSIQEKRTG